MTGKHHDDPAPDAGKNAPRRKQDDSAQILPFRPRPTRTPPPVQPPEPPSAA